MAKRQTILVVEDEADLAELLRHNIEREGYHCRLAADGQSALREMSKHPPDLILLDRMLPGMSGDEFVAAARRDPRTAKVQVIMLTAKAEESDELVGFALGADDYITKPFSMKLVLARIGAMLRRREATLAKQDLLEAGPIRLDVNRFEVSVEGKPIALTVTEFGLLKALLAANGRVLSRGQLIDTVMGTGVAVTDRTIDVHMASVRKKLGEAAQWIQTVRGIGYTCRQP
jgi:DNA-binding response OmpR family regulator